MSDDCGGVIEMEKCDGTRERGDDDDDGRIGLRYGGV